MLHVLTVIAPMFVLLGAGMVAGFSAKFRSAQAGLNAFVYTCALPAFLFVAVTDANIRDGVPFAFVAISLGVTSAVFFAVYVGATLAQRLRGARAGGDRGAGARTSLGGTVAPGPLAVASTYGNVGYLGVPIVLSIVGPEAALGAALGQLLHNVLFMAGYPLLRSFDRSGPRVSVGDMLWRAAKSALLLNPVVISVVAGVLVSLFEVPLPGVITDSIGMLGNAAVPTAMFAVGLSIKPAFDGMRSGSISIVGVSVATAAKIVVMPLATLGVALIFADHLTPMWIAAGTIMAAMPVSSTASIVVFEQDGDSRLVGATTLVTSVLAVVTIPVMIAML